MVVKKLTLWQTTLFTGAIGCLTLGGVTHEERLLVPFDTAPYELRLGRRRDSGLPVEAFMTLFAVNRSTRKLIARPHDLSGIVRIRSKGEALAYCRLFTDLGTHYLFADVNAIEVFRQGHAVRLYRRGEVSRGQQPFYGIAEPEIWKKLRLSSPVVREGRAGFIVERTLISLGRPRLYRSLEKVGRDGSYRKTEKVLIEQGEHPLELRGIRIPMYR